MNRSLAVRIVGFLAFALFFSSPPARAQDPDEIGLKCMQAKLKAAGKDCACVHKAWAVATAKGTLPDFSLCEEKLDAAFAKAESKALAAGGACYLGEAAAAVKEAIAAAADKTVTQTGRGTVTPQPDGCDLSNDFAKYEGGNYSKAPKCVPLQGGEVGCGPLSQAKLESAIANDVKCPKLCTAEEKGCDPQVSIAPDDMEQKGQLCCLKSDPDDAKKSETGLISCTLCYTP